MQSCRLNKTCGIRPVGILALAAFLTSTIASSLAQEQIPPERPPQQRLPKEGASIGGFPMRDVVPQRPPRPSAADWQSGQNDAPVSKFIENLKGNDGVIQAIVGQGRLITLREAAAGAGPRFIAVGDPSIIDFEVLPNPRMIRILGKRAGVTDLSITTGDNQTYSFEVHVTWDIPLIQAQLKQTFPDADIRLSQLREHIVVEGQARSPSQVARIIETVEAYQKSMLVENKGALALGAPGPVTKPGPSDVAGRGSEEGAQAQTVTDMGGRPSAMTASGVAPQVINLLRIPGVQQVMLQVKIAELNRTALRRIGADLFGQNSKGTTLGTRIAGNTISTATGTGGDGLTSLGTLFSLGPDATAFGLFPASDFAILLTALRRNSLLSILAEPNLVTMSGQEASFLAGGEFPVPVPQASGGLNNTITVIFKNFGVQLHFVPTVLDDETIRLVVNPEVSSIDFALGTTLVTGGQAIPGLNTRRASTTVEIRQNETLAIAGLLSVTIDGQTDRIPGLGDLPYIGPLFSNTHHERIEKELLIMVSPVLVHPIPSDKVGCLPGAEIKDPTDIEFYLKNRIEGCISSNFRSTVAPWDYRQRCDQQKKYERKYIQGPTGFSEP